MHADYLHGPILFLQKSDALLQHRSLVLQKLEASASEIKVNFASSPHEIPEKNFPIVIAPTLPWLPEAMDSIRGCRWIHFLSAGVEKIWDMPFSKGDMLMTKSSGIHGPQISEYVIGAMLHFAKCFDEFIEQSRAREWSRRWLGELTNQTVTILGAGHIGQTVGKRAKAFDMRVIGVQRTARPQRDFDEVIRMEAVGGVLGNTDYLVVCLPLTTVTRGLVNESMLEALKPGAALIDVSRGGVVVEKAVVSALESGRLRGAALDVFECQPLPINSSLWGSKNVLITPHVSGTSPHYIERALDIFLANLECLRRGDDALTPVDLNAGY